MTASVMFDQNFEPQKEVGKETLDFIMKLQTNPANASLHIEPINGSVDKRVRTGRVTLQYRAVLVELNGKDGKHFLVLAVMNHDDAIAYAKKVKVGVNAVNGNFEITQEAAAPDHVDVEAEIESRAKKLAAEKLAQLQAEEQAKAAQAADEKLDDAPLSAPDVPVEPAEPTPAAVTPPREVLAELGVTDTQLLDDIGLSPVALEAIRRAGDEEELDGLLSLGPAWELDAVIGLLSGKIGRAHV